MGESQQYRSTPKLYFVTSAVIPQGIWITGITHYRTVPKYQNADVVRLSTEKSKFVKTDPKMFFFFQIWAPKIACVLNSSAFNTKWSTVVNLLQNVVRSLMSAGGLYLFFLFYFYLFTLLFFN